MATNAEFWESSSYGPGDTNATYEFLNSRSPNRYHLMRILRTKGMREVGEFLFTALADNTPSDTMSVTMSQLTASADTTDNVQGGVRTIAAKELVGANLNSDKDDTGASTSRASKAGDVTVMNTEVIPSGSRANRAPGTYPTDVSGNGGGGKQAAGG